MGTTNTVSYSRDYEVNGTKIRGGNAFLLIRSSYRLNVFGFPNAKGLADQNLGLLDQRLAYGIPDSFPLAHY
jgi:carboxylesterase type B